MLKINLRVLLAERDLTISKVSRDTGISRTTLTALVKNNCKGFQFDTLDTLCTYLRVSPSDIMHHTHISQDNVPIIEDFEVIPATVGQYTELTDKKGKKIFEGDIVCAVYKAGYTGIPDTNFGIGIIEYQGTYYGGASYHIDIIGEAGSRVFSASLEMEIIGNIHDNPELLEQ